MFTYKINQAWRHRLIGLFCKSSKSTQTFSNKYLYFSRFLQIIFKNNNHGLTLIELLVVTIIVSILAAFAFPTLVNQVAKSRETDAKNILGLIVRTQQAYHFEKKSFANDINALNIAGINQSSYYNFPNPSFADSNIVKHQAIASNPTNTLVKNYAIGVYHSSGLYDSAVCVAFDINQAVDVGNTVSDKCTNSGIKLK